MQKTITTKEACPCVLKRKLSIVTALPMSSITRRLGDYMHHNNIHCLLTKKIILYRFFFKKKKDSSLTIRFNNPARLGDCAERKQYVPKTQERVKTPAKFDGCLRDFSLFSVGVFVFVFAYCRFFEKERLSQDSR